MEFHEAANIFPMMTAEEMAGLVDSISQGYDSQFPILTYESKILDGRNRYAACLKAGVEPVYSQWTGSDPVGFVVNANLNRRHLTSSQRAVIALEIERVLAGRAKRKEQERKTTSQIIEKSQESIYAADQAAKMVGTNRQYIHDAKKIEREAPDMLEKIRTGEMTIPEVKREIEQGGVFKAKQAMAVTTYSHNSLEYYTPAWVLDAAREVMGGIDLDPASCEEAQANVNATEYYTIDDDGLSREWSGRVWLNPPYSKTDGRSNQDIWSQRLIEEYNAGNVTEAVLLVKAALGYKWFEQLFDTLPVCLMRERLSFILDDGNDDGQSKQGTAIFYLGNNFYRFYEVFRKYGRVIPPAEVLDGLLSK